MADNGYRFLVGSPRAPAPGPLGPGDNGYRFLVGAPKAVPLLPSPDDNGYQFLVAKQEPAPEGEG